MLKRFYLLFESIYKYAQDFLFYLEELDQGVFIQLTLDLVLLNVDGKQLLSEALFLYGVMLLLADERIPGPIRERMLVSYLRYQGSEVELMDEVCRLMRSTGYTPGNAHREGKGFGYPANYPTSFFQRMKIPKTVITMVVGRLRSDDVYNQISAYPSPDHRSSALATQASMLYVILYFAPEILHKQQAVMREIVDKHFADNWIVSYYLGFMVDLSLVWQPYAAARAALNNTLDPDNVKYCAGKHLQKVGKLLTLLDGYLTEGVLVREYILDNSYRLLHAVRELNVTIRWILLHTNTVPKALAAITTHGYDPAKTLMLVLKTAQFEFVLKNIFQELLDNKEDNWDTCKTQSSERMKELAEYFSGEKALTRVAKNESLQKWFGVIAEKVEGLNYADSTLAGRKIQQLITALEEVEQFHQIESSLHIKQFLEDTRQFLQQMIRIVNIKEEYLVIMSVVSDMSYAWQVIDNYQPHMHRLIKADPSYIVMLRSTFLKLSSILDLPLVRINQASSPDLVSVSEYYSGQLVGFVRRVLEVIPRSMFDILSQIIEIQTNHLQELPTKLEKDKLREMAQLEQRYKLSKLTHGVSVFTEGILAMETTLVGVIKVDPKQLLEDGIRKQLVRTIASRMHLALDFEGGSGSSSSSGSSRRRSRNNTEAASLEVFERALKQLATQLDGLKRSFQYIQDYVTIYGLKIWQEEFSRIVNYNVEQECNMFLKKKVYSWQSSFQSTAIPIPEFPSTDAHSINFVGRLANQLLKHTDCYRTVYLDQMAAWYSRDGRELVGIRTFDLLTNAVGVYGVAGLDRLFSFKIVRELQWFTAKLRDVVDPEPWKPRRGDLATHKASARQQKIYQRKLAEAKAFNKEIAGILASLSPTSTIPKQTHKLYLNAVGSTARLWPLFFSVVVRVGQLQLLRRQIANLLNYSCKLDSNALSCSLDALNKALIADVQAHYLNPDEKPYPDDDSPLLSDLSEFLESAGINDPFTKIYITTSPIDSISLLLFLFLVSRISSFHFNDTLNAMLSRNKKEPADFTSLVVGIITVLKQFHSSHTQKFLAYIGQYIRGYLNMALGSSSANSSKKPLASEFPPEVTNMLRFVEEYVHYARIDRKSLQAYFPPFVFASVLS